MLHIDAPSVPRSEEVPFCSPACFLHLLVSTSQLRLMGLSRWIAASQPAIIERWKLIALVSEKVACSFGVSSLVSAITVVDNMFNLIMLNAHLLFSFSFRVLRFPAEARSHGVAFVPLQYGSFSMCMNLWSYKDSNYSITRQRIV